jgi:hypothetical protein
MTVRMLALWLAALVVAQYPDASPQDAPLAAPQVAPKATVSAGSISSERLREVMHVYVRGERLAAIPFGISGLVQTLTGALLLTSSNSIARGAAWPLLVFGVVGIASALAFGLRSQGPALDTLLDEGTGRFLEHERKHAHRITHVFQPALLAVEAVVTATGGILAGAGAARHDDTMAGVGFGLAVGGLVLFLLDWAVLDRAQGYEAALGSSP